MNESIAPERPIKTFVKKRLDGYMGAVVAANIGMMILMTQWAGGNANFALNEASEPWPWFTQGLFDGCEYVFYSLYLMDVLLRAFVLRREWCYDAVDGIQFMNMFDAFLVLISTGELIILPALFSGGTDLQTDAVRLLKLVRIVRTLRIIKAVSAFRQLRVLVATCLASIGALIWSMILLVVLKVAVSLMAGQALQTFILDENEDLDARIEMNTLYGSFTKSFYTFFEITHSGSWPSRVRPVLEKVSPWYSIIFLPYIALVVFAVIRVVTALFIKETLASAANDAEMVIEESRRMALEYQARLEELFHLVDYDGDGHLSAEEFVQAMELPSVQQYLKFLEVTVRDCRPLFEILAEGDGRITIAEFCKGLMQIKGQARALDIVVLQHENSKMMEQNHEILTILRAFSRKSRTARGSSAECSQRLHVPSGEKVTTSLEESLLQALDAKFAEQEKVIRELLSGNGVRRPPPMEPWSFVSEPPSMPVFHHASEQSEAPKNKVPSGNLDMLIAGVVVINVIMMIIHSQWVAWKSEVELNLIEPSDSMFSTQAFDVIEYIFFSIYCSDMLVRMIVLRKEWYFDPKVGVMYMNIFDAFLVLLNFTELFMIPLIDPEGTDLNTNHIRLIKFTRVARTLRIVRGLSILRQLRALIATCIASLGALFWSLILLLLMKVMFALVISQAIQLYVMSDADYDVRILMNSWYGSFLRAMYTMFEITYSGGWPLLVRPVIEMVSPWYSIPFLLYVVFVVFAAIRIVTALFLKETLSTAANDAELVIEDSRRTAVQYQKKLEELFRLVDDDGDGNLTPEEFVEAMSLPSVDLYLRYLEITIRDCGPLFDILSGEDGLITISEFCQGIMQLKGNARALDMVVLQHENAKLMKECMRIRKYLEKGWNRTYSQ
ncbi:Sodium channel protein type 11 subunit alpha (NaN) (Sensory neuron sodium channel 2) (Sodium channel protein type XI subunit alpha) (Voltage-gated sodium channel subunit alpha Nav1.9) [Durusdinium trenchii]|uniref:Sodium channel protein type 11 subunit alpha (NaN) (Sensory neuron sodium channel 2) (Sodium channel protein type XI subunit alpha) (Voltage-gated sodium channel subunit alpha Nav1.9) n=1 Tax=Durusdinium trenchii TaxID=1381693 RepID=A0ABP0KCJ4_9DINO